MDSQERARQEVGCDGKEVVENIMYGVIKLDRIKNKRICSRDNVSGGISKKALESRLNWIRR